MTLCPSSQGDGLEIHWALPAGARIPSVSYAKHMQLMCTSEVACRCRYQFSSFAQPWAQPARSVRIWVGRLWKPFQLVSAATGDKSRHLRCRAPLFAMFCAAWLQMPMSPAAVNRGGWLGNDMVPRDWQGRKLGRQYGAQGKERHAARLG